MNFDEATEYIFSFSSLGAKPSLERIENLLAFLKQPQASFKSVHIAGTNGKGSTATYISSVLTEAGYRTGLFTSPHIVTFRERIKVDGKMISELDVVRLTEKLIPFISKMREKPTAFDIITAIAFEYFSEKKCDFAVLECGLGGKFDSTNTVIPEVGVLCSISLDHLGVLGSTVEEITREKCGIIKAGVPIVSYPFEETKDVFNPQRKESRDIIEATALKMGSRLIVADPKRITSSSSSLDGTNITVDGLALHSPLAGEHQKANMLTAYTALNVLSEKYDIPSDAIVSGFSKAQISARFEKVNDNPTVIVDGGHNADCARALRLFVENEIDEEKPTAVIAMMRDKQCDTVLSQTASLFGEIIVTEVKSERACTAEELLDTVKKYNPCAQAEADACTAIKKALKGKNTVIIFGSFYLAGEAKEFFSS